MSNVERDPLELIIYGSEAQPSSIEQLEEMAAMQLLDVEPLINTESLHEAESGATVLFTAIRKEGDDPEKSEIVISLSHVGQSSNAFELVFNSDGTAVTTDGLAADAEPKDAVELAQDLLADESISGQVKVILRHMHEHLERRMQSSDATAYISETIDIAGMKLRVADLAREIIDDSISCEVKMRHTATVLDNNCTIQVIEHEILGEPKDDEDEDLPRLQVLYTDPENGLAYCFSHGRYDYISLAVFDPAHEVDEIFTDEGVDELVLEEFARMCAAEDTPRQQDVELLIDRLEAAAQQ